MVTEQGIAVHLLLLMDKDGRIARALLHNLPMCCMRAKRTPAIATEVAAPTRKLCVLKWSGQYCTVCSAHLRWCRQLHRVRGCPDRNINRRGRCLWRGDAGTEPCSRPWHGRGRLPLSFGVCGWLGPARIDLSWSEPSVECSGYMTIGCCHVWCVVVG